MSATPMLLRRTSKACYAYGLYMLSAEVFAILAVVLAMLTIYSGGNTYYYFTTSMLESFEQALFPGYFLAWIVFGVIALVVSVFLSFNLFKVGKAYDLASFRASSLLIVAGQVLSLAMILAFYSFSMPILPVYPSPTVTLESLYLSYITLIALGAIGITYFVLLIIGTGRLSEKTGVKSFDSARTLMIVGIFILFLFPIGLFKFGSGLKQLVVLRDGVICSVCGKSVDPRAVFCKFCGARIKKEKD